MSVNRICIACNLYYTLQAFHVTCLTLAPVQVQVHVIFPERLSSSSLVKELQEAVKGLSIKMLSWDCTETLRHYELVLRKYLFKTKSKTQETFHIKEQSGMLVAN